MSDAYQEIIANMISFASARKNQAADAGIVTVDVPQKSSGFWQDFAAITSATGSIESAIYAGGGLGGGGGSGVPLGVLRSQRATFSGSNITFLAAPSSGYFLFGLVVVLSSFPTNSLFTLQASGQPAIFNAEKIPEQSAFILPQNTGFSAGQNLILSGSSGGSFQLIGVYAFG